MAAKVATSFFCSKDLAMPIVQVALLAPLLIGFAMLAMPVQASDTTASATDEAKRGDKIKCRHEAEMGSRTRSKKNCKSVAEWEQDARQQKRNLDSSLNKSQAWTGGKPQ